MLAAAVVLLKIFERGSLPLDMGINGMTVAMFGVALVTVWIAPRGAGLFVGLLTVARPDVGRLLRADVQRYALIFGCPPRFSPPKPVWPSAHRACSCSAPSRLQRRRLTDCPPPC